jgi:hypothetical protein
MTKFRGLIGINRGTQETTPGVHEQVIDEIEVTGEMRNPSVRWQSSEQHESTALRHILSIVTPESDLLQFYEAVYIIWQGIKWSITGVEYKRPRVELSLGSKYNG